MRLTDLPRTTSFRLALLFLLLFGMASLILFTFLFVRTNGYLVEMTDDWLNREQVVFAHLDRQAFLERLAAHVIADPEAERPFTLFDAIGHQIAGTPLQLPTAKLADLPLGSPFNFAPAQSGANLPYRGLARRTPSGDLLLIAENMADARRFNEILIHTLMWGGLVTCLLGLIGAAIAGADAVRRIDAVTHATQRIMGGDLAQRLPTHGRTGDLDRLIHVINGMLEDIERLMQDVKGVSDSIAHDLRTPLTRLLGGLERVRRRARTPEEYADAVDDAIVETRNLLGTFTAMLRISEVESGARRAGFTSVNLGQLVTDAVELYEPMAEEKGITLQLGPARIAAVMRGDPSLLFEAVGNLVNNAIKFTPPGGNVAVCTFARGGRMGIEVTDTG
ncbi:MAG TPA: histidine kinase dimerization/phospho-acceptor domain-containing protein, partial [Bradyrhizobium sp.]|nr:histidine kinase dimerization/phospho-acceptor domain-containing protein [Bradyrhizobium sp.]